MSTPDPTHEAKVPSLRVAIERLFAIETLMRRGSPIATERATALEEIRAALAADAEERKEIVAVPIDDARLIRRVFLPSNPNKMRNADPAVVDAARRFIAILAKLEGTQR